MADPIPKLRSVLAICSGANTGVINVYQMIEFIQRCSVRSIDTFKDFNPHHVKDMAKAFYALPTDTTQIGYLITRQMYTYYG